MLICECGRQPSHLAPCAQMYAATLNFLGHNHVPFVLVALDVLTVQGM